MSKHRLEFKGVDIEVEYDYQPEERMVMYYPDGSGYPGCAESFDITKVSLVHGSTRIDVTELCEGMFEKIEMAIREDQSE